MVGEVRVGFVAFPQNLCWVELLVCGGLLFWRKPAQHCVVIDGPQEAVRHVGFAIIGGEGAPGDESIWAAGDGAAEEEVDVFGAYAFM